MDPLRDAIALTSVSPEDVSDWLGAPCNCDSRRYKKMLLHRWAKDALSGRLPNPEQKLNLILSIKDE